MRLPVRTTGADALIRTIVFGVLSTTPCESVSKCVTTGLRLSTKRSQISILPSFATDAKHEEVFGSQTMSFT